MCDYMIISNLIDKVKKWCNNNNLEQDSPEPTRMGVVGDHRYK